MMTREELIAKLKECSQYPSSIEGHYDVERGHIDADQALLAYINDPEITEAFDSLEKWYS